MTFPEPFFATFVTLAKNSLVNSPRPLVKADDVASNPGALFDMICLTVTMSSCSA